MSTPPPFLVSPEAEDYMRFVMPKPRTGEELALIRVPRQAEIVDGQEQVWFDGEHFMLCVFDVGRRSNATQIELLGHPVSIVPSTLELLRGRTLGVRRVSSRSGELRDVLVAA